jgi:hypothetical protein
LAASAGRRTGRSARGIQIPIGWPPW